MMPVEFIMELPIEGQAEEATPREVAPVDAMGQP
jgi:hypothetical protein